MANHYKMIIESARATPKAHLPYDMFLTRLFRHVIELYPHLDNGIYDVVERVMRPLALRQTLQPRSDRGKARHSVSSTFAHHNRGSSSHQGDDDEIDGASRASTPSPTTYLNSLGPLNYQQYDVPTSSKQNDDLLFKRQTDLLNQTQQMHKELRSGFKSFGKALQGVFNKKKNALNAPSKTPSTKCTSSSSIDYTPKLPTSSISPSPNGYLNLPTSPPLKVPPPLSTQENESMDITLTVSPITPLDAYKVTIARFIGALERGGVHIKGERSPRRLVKSDGCWRVKLDGCWRVKPDGNYWKSLGDLGQWHLPNGTLCVPTELESRPNPEALNQEVRKPDNINSMSTRSKLPKNFMNNGHKAIPMSSNATGSGRDGEDTSVNQGGKHFYYSTPNGAELHSLSLNHGFTDQNFLESVWENTDVLDAAGNTKKVTTKWFAIGSAALASFLLFSVYMDEVATFSHTSFTQICKGKDEAENNNFSLKELQNVEQQLETALKRIRTQKICKGKDEAEVWFSGLKAQISHGHQRKWRIESRSDGIPLKLIVLGPIRVEALH
ncbi:ribosomal protein L7Ae/L30e/S12e/Gadd45 [Tanacetum coccineum]